MSEITEAFRTKTIFEDRKNPAAQDKWCIAVDIGYSGTKIYSPNCIACFPSFATKIEGNFIDLSKPDFDSIFYKDKVTGEIWKVGRLAQNGISSRDAELNSTAIYGRQRYYDPMYLVIARTAIGIACRENEFGAPGNRKVALQTGLPNKYLKADQALLKDVLCGTHLFSIRVGSGGWMDFNISLGENDIFAMHQPLGTLLSVSMNDNGSYAKGYERYYKSNGLICDPGFGTIDCFTVNNGTITEHDLQTLSTFTMREILSRTSADIFKVYGEEIPVPSMQKYLETGQIMKFNRRDRKGEYIDFSNILQENCRNVAEEAVEKLCELYGDLLDFDYMILTGGTGEAWYPYFKEAFAGLPNLTLVPGNINTGAIGEGKPLPFIFSNVRGYYFFVQKSH